MLLTNGTPFEGFWGTSPFGVDLSPLAFHAPCLHYYLEELFSRKRRLLLLLLLVLLVLLLLLLLLLLVLLLLLLLFGTVFAEALDQHVLQPVIDTLQAEAVPCHVLRPSFSFSYKVSAPVLAGFAMKLVLDARNTALSSWLELCPNRQVLGDCRKLHGPQTPLMPRERAREPFRKKESERERERERQKGGFPPCP